MTILRHNLEQLSPPTQVTMGDLSNQVQGIQILVNDTIEKMRNQKEILLEKKRKIEEIAVMCECPENGMGVFASILRETGDINSKEALGWTVFRYAILGRRIKLIELLLAHPDILVSEKNDDGRAPLFLTLNHEGLEVLNILLKDGRLDINERNDKDSLTLLTKASMLGRIDILELLLADPRMDIDAHDQATEAYKRAKDKETKMFIESKIGWEHFIPF